MPIWSICPLCNCYSSFPHKNEEDCRNDLRNIIESLKQFRTNGGNFTPRRKEYK